jgi:hypothetical protein
MGLSAVPSKDKAGGRFMSNRGNEGLGVSTEELKTFARLTGHENVHSLNREDLVTTSFEISHHTDIPHV